MVVVVVVDAHYIVGSDYIVGVLAVNCIVHDAVDFDRCHLSRHAFGID